MSRRFTRRAAFRRGLVGASPAALNVLASSIIEGAKRHQYELDEVIARIENRVRDERRKEESKP